MIKSKFSTQIHKRKKNRSKHLDLRVFNPRRTALWSWAFPKVRFPEVSEKFLAIRTPDHDISYFAFEGTLRNGDIITLFDGGHCDIVIDKQLHKTMFFRGSKIKGLFTFIKIYGSKTNSWIVIKSKKEYKG